MHDDANGNPDKTYAAVCGLYCEACSWYIATTEEPERLKRLAVRMQFSEEDSRCFGCRSDKRIPYCMKCTMSACAAGRGIDFCSECGEYPCEELKRFQAAMPHRIDLWANLDRIRDAGYARWLTEIRGEYTCPKCGAVNPAYDLACRKCGEEPSCNYVARHRREIERYLKSRE